MLKSLEALFDALSIRLTELAEDAEITGDAAKSEAFGKAASSVEDAATSLGITKYSCTDAE
jgi:hypothetical protein